MSFTIRGSCPRNLIKSIGLSNNFHCPLPTANSLKIFSAKEFNTTAFILGMIPPVVVCILFIMKLGYRSRYASTAVEDEALEEERIAYETNNINIFT